VPGREYEIADSPEEFAAQVLAVLEPGTSAEMGRLARGAHHFRLRVGPTSDIRSVAGRRYGTGRHARGQVKVAMHADPQLQTAASVRGVQQPGYAFGAIASRHRHGARHLWPTTDSMIEIWRRSETFQHCFAVIPSHSGSCGASVRGWPQHRCRRSCRDSPVIALLGFAWLLGLLGAAQVVSQFARSASSGGLLTSLAPRGHGSSGFRCCSCSLPYRSAKRWCRD